MLAEDDEGVSFAFERLALIVCVEEQGDGTKARRSGPGFAALAFRASRPSRRSISPEPPNEERNWPAITARSQPPLTAVSFIVCWLLMLKRRAALESEDGFGTSSALSTT